MNNRLSHELRKFKGQPIEFITESGFKFCGTEIEVDDDTVEIIDDCGRIVDIPLDHIDAVVEPQMKLKRLCGDNDCDCDDDDDDDDGEGRRGRRNRRNHDCDCD